MTLTRVGNQKATFNNKAKAIEQKCVLNPVLSTKAAPNFLHSLAIVKPKVMCNFK